MIENREDPKCWDNAPKENVRAVGVLYDPLPLYDQPWETANGRTVGIYDRHGRHIRLEGIQHILDATVRRNYAFFHYKDVAESIAPISIAGTVHDSNNHYKSWFGLVIGIVVDSQGHCVYLEAWPDRSVYTKYSSIYELGLNEELFPYIYDNLETLGTEVRA